MQALSERQPWEHVSPSRDVTGPHSSIFPLRFGAGREARQLETRMTTPKAKTAEDSHVAAVKLLVSLIGTHWDEGHLKHTKEALDSYADSVAEERVKIYAEKVNQQMRDDFEHWKELNGCDHQPCDACMDKFHKYGFRAGQEGMRERAAKTDRSGSK